MAETRDELHDDLMALLAAGRELPPDTDADLAAMFLGRLRRQSAQRDGGDYWLISKRAASIGFVSAVWLAAVAILGYIPYYYYTHNTDVPSSYYQTVPAVLTVAILISLIAYVVNIAHWLPRVRIVVTPRHEDA